MKRTSIISTAAFIIAACSIFYFAKSITTPAITVNKNINLEVYKTASYISPVYSKPTASFEVIVVRVKNNIRDTVWKHSFEPTGLKDFPEANKPITQKISIPNVNDCKEQLEVYYKVTYNSEGSILNYRNYATIDPGQQNKNLVIPI